MVVSELRRRVRHLGLVQWLSGKPPDSLFLSAVTIGEIERGIVRQRAADPAFADALATWLGGLVTIYAERILPLDVRSARRWGELGGRLGHDGADLMIAATAIEHGMIVVTRNARHFVPTGVAVENPYD